MRRKGSLEARSVRPPGVTVGPGKPNKGGSWFAGSIIREPLSGVDAICPVARDTRVWVISPRTVVANLIVGHEAPATKFAYTRSINVPGILVGVGEMVDSLRRIAGEPVAHRVKLQLYPVIDRVVQPRPGRFAPVL